MIRCIVVWTTHEHAIIVSTTDGAEKVLHSKPKAREGVGKGQRQPLDQHHRKAVHAIQDAQEIFIFGPAQANLELKSEILKVPTRSHRVVGPKRWTEHAVVVLARARALRLRRAITAPKPINT